MSRAATAAGQVLAVDLGTTGLKVAVVAPDGRLRSWATEPLDLHVGPRGAVEQDADQWWAALGRCARQAIAAAGVNAAEVGLVAVTSQYMSTVPVDAAGRPTGPVIMWMDGRGQARAPQLDPAAAQRWRQLHGRLPDGFEGISHVATIRADLPDAYQRAVAFVEPMDALAGRLTGRVVSSQHTAYPMLVTDNRTWGATGYCAELVERSGLDPTKLAPLVGADEPRGRVTAEAAGHLGVSAGALVTAPTIDSVTTAIGTGAVGPERCGLSIGTTTVVATHVAGMFTDVDHDLGSAPSAVPGRHILLAENGVGGKTLEIFATQWFPGRAGVAEALDEAEQRAAMSPPGANGVVFCPWLIGSLAPQRCQDVRGAFLGLGLFTDAADLSRAVLEGVALNAAWLMPHLSAATGHRYDEVVLGGGGASSAQWAQIVADCLEVTVHRLASPRTMNAHGAALLALAHTGALALSDVPEALTIATIHHPDPATTGVYRAALGELIRYHQFASAARAAPATTEDRP